MKTIFIPTDFSVNALHAACYALELNRKFNAEVILFHSYVIPVYSTDVPVVLPGDAMLRENAVRALDVFRNQLSEAYPGTNFKTLASQGYAEDEIVAAAKKENADMIIMGTQGATGIREVLVGTNTASVMEHAHCPVMAVPEAADFTKIRRIVFATNYAEGDFFNIEKVIEFARPHEADVVLLHISSGEFEKTYEFESIERFKERISEDSNYKHVSFHLMESHNIYEGLNEFLDNSGADMIAMTMRKRSFIQKLFSRSVTRKMAYHSHLPLIGFRTAS